MLFSVYAITDTKQIIKGTSEHDSASDALAKVHKLAASKNIHIVKATVRKVDGDSTFKISDAREDAEGAPKTAAKKRSR